LCNAYGIEVVYLLDGDADIDSNFTKDVSTKNVKSFKPKKKSVLKNNASKI